MENKKTNCKNCEQEFQEEFNFCPNCGQKSKDTLTMGVLFYNTISNYFSVDARFLKSFFPLLFRPGYMAKKFVSGKRLLYLHPAQFYLFTSIVFFFLFSFQSRELNQELDKVLKKTFEKESLLKLDSTSKKVLDSINLTKLTQPLKDSKLITLSNENELKKIDSIIKESPESGNIFNFNKGKLDSLVASGATVNEQLKYLGMEGDSSYFQRRFYTQMLKFHKNRGGGILQAFFDSIPISLFILLPIFAFILKIFFWRRGSFPHHLVFSFYYFSFLFVMLGIILLANFFWEVPDIIEALIILSTYIYLLIAVKKFYLQSYFLSFIKTGMVLFIYMIIVLPIATGIMILSSFLLY